MDTLKAGRMTGCLLRLVALGLSLSLIGSAVTAAPPDSTPGASNNRRVFPQLDLPARAYGEEAIAQLGDQLPAVAAFYGMATANFARMLREDHTAWIDQQGRLLFIDEFPEPAGEAEITDPLQSAPFLQSETFKLHSRPGANRVVYLDFDGHVTTESAWNNSSGQATIVSPPYNYEGDASTFTSREHEYIQKMWRQVAEDYAPFDVDVTTEDPGDEAIFRRDSGDQQYGTRVVITQNNFYDCSCGGVAYVGVYDRISASSPQYYQPAWVFNTSLVGAGEAISHEAGHNLGLSHDGAPGTGYYQGHGSGATGWAPIMGVGYYQQLVQWSKGEYDGATQTQDDIVVIQSNGAPLSADDHGDSAAAATALAVSTDGITASLSGSGAIGIREDFDVFSFISGAGNYSINVDPAPFSPNLDIRASLFDVSGTLLASSNPADSLPAALSGTLAAGEYFLEVDGTGKGDPLGTGYNDYASLGRYTVSAAVPDPGGLAAPVARITANYTPDYASVLVGFDSVGSTDSDGSIASFDWQFGDGNSGSGATWDHTYTAPGTYLATLTVTDNEGLQGSDSVSVEVYNRAPVAVASADESSGMAPFSVVFSSAGSNDPDGPQASGFIASYAWDFGDGTNSSDPNPSHTYNTDGLITATLVVTDNLGATGAANVQLDITPSPITHQHAYGEQLVAGTVTGSYTMTHAEDNSWQEVGERESGGRKTRRHSLLEHIWLFNVKAANEVTLDLIAQQGSSNDNDAMEFSYSVNNGTYHPIVTLDATPVTISGFALSEAQSGGTVRIRVVDSDREPGNRSLDTVSVNLLHILSNNEGGPSDPPSGVPQLNSVEATSSSAIALQWSYAGSDASGFRIERSTDGGPWSSAGTVAANQLTYADSGLTAATDYAYSVVPFNSVDDGSASNVLSARTGDASAIVLQVSGRKVKGVQHADLSWTESGSVAIYRSDIGYLDIVSGSGYPDNIGNKGGGSYIYQVCDTVSGDCSDEVTVVF